MKQFTTIDALVLSEILEDAVRPEAMLRFRNQAAGDIRTKNGPLDLVTEASEAAERLNTMAIPRESLDLS